MSSNNNLPNTISEKEIEKRLNAVIDKIINDLIRAAETAPPPKQSN